MVFILATFSNVFAADSIVKVIKLHYKTASEVIPLLKPVLREGDKISGQNSSIVINTTPDNLTRIRYLIHKIDVPPIMYLIAIRQGNAHGNTSNLGDVIEYNTQSNAEQLRNQTIKVLDGETAFINTGKQVPVIESAGIGWWNAGVTYQRKNISQGFWIEPHQQGSQVLLKIYRKREQANRQKNQTINYQTAMTTMRVPVNQWIELGSSRSSGMPSDNNTIVYQTGNQYNQTANLYIKVSILKQQLLPTK